jgi:hypothetical protein
MSTPELALQAIFPQPVVSGPYRICPPTLLHLAALDRLGINLSAGRIGADAVAKAGFIFTRTPAELFELMAGPLADVQQQALLWASQQSARDWDALTAGVVAAVNAAFSTAMPGAEADPQTGHPQTSDGPSK